MPRPVFISYARSDSASEAQALAAALGEEAYLDTISMQEGKKFPKQLLDAMLEARIVVLFASENYLASTFCRAEMRLALHAGGDDASHIVVARGAKPEDVLEVLPEEAANTDWPVAAETENIVAQVRQRLAAHPKTIEELLPRAEAEDIAEFFLQEASIPAPRSLSGITVSFPPGLSPQSIGRRFVGRANDMRRLHGVLAQRSGGAACLSTRIAAGAGFGKTRMAIEYLYRYGSHYPGGIFWVNADSSTMEEEFWRVLSRIDPATPDIAILRGQNPSIAERLGNTLRNIQKPVLYIADNIPEAGPEASPQPLESYCPGIGAVTLLATSRQDTFKGAVERIEIQQLGRPSAILLLKKDVRSAGSLNRDEWSRIAEWAGDLPVVLDLLNQLLIAKAISPKKLLARCDEPPSTSTTTTLDEMAKALRGQVSEQDLKGIADALLLSYEKLDPATQKVARILAQLAPTPIPEELLDVLPDEICTGATRAALQSRHFVTSSEGNAFGVMHRLTADFLRSLPEDPDYSYFETACQMVEEVMTYDRCRDPKDWPLMKECQPHAEALFGRGQSEDQIGAAACRMGARVEVLADARGNYAQARELQERVLEVRRRVLGDEHPDTLTSMNNLALTLWAQRELEAARDLGEKALETRKEFPGRRAP